MTQVRRAKSDHKVSMRAAVSRAVISGPAAYLDLLRQVEADLRESGSIADLVWQEADEPSIEVELADS